MRTQGGFSTPPTQPVVAQMCCESLSARQKAGHSFTDEELLDILKQVSGPPRLDELQRMFLPRGNRGMKPNTSLAGDGAKKGGL
jgi:hypothetical protein